MRNSFILVCSDCFASVSAWGRPRAGPAFSRSFTLTATSSCSDSERLSHHSANVSAYSTSHAIEGICDTIHIYVNLERITVLGCDTLRSEKSESRTAPFAKPAKSAAPGKERAHPCKNRKNTRG